MDSTIGVTKRVNKPAEDDSVLVKVMKHQGAVPFCKTNIPQTLLRWDQNLSMYIVKTKGPLDIPQQKLKITFLFKVLYQINDEIKKISIYDAISGMIYLYFI